MPRMIPFSSRVSRVVTTLLSLMLVGFVALSGCALARKTSRKQPALDGMVHVPAGEFVMGRDAEDAADDERPVHTVWVSEFYIDATEVTNAEFQAFCDQTSRLYPNNPMWDDAYFLENPNHPVINITYEQATSYCAWKGKRLPTEAEWEKAARGVDERLYPWGNDWDETRMNFWGDKHGTDVFYNTAPVGSFVEGASPFGALDMLGNVWEWCSDWFAEDYYEVGPKRDPRGPEGPAVWRVVRGGSFSSPRRSTGDAIIANRSKNHPSQPHHGIGCRCVWSPED